MLYKNQNYVNFDQFVSCFVMVSVNKSFWQQVIVLLPRNLWNTNVSIELNKRNTVFNTNIEEFPLEIIHFILLFTKQRDIFKNIF
jgi:hypothetical protein